MSGAEVLRCGEAGFLCGAVATVCAVDSQCDAAQLSVESSYEAESAVGAAVIDDDEQWISSVDGVGDPFQHVFECIG